MFRLYGIYGCPNCVAAEQLLQKLGLPTQLIDVGGDPVAGEGIKVITGSKDVVRVPVLVLLGHSAEVVIGFDPEKYRQVIRTFKGRELANADAAFDTVLGSLNGGATHPNGEAAGPAAPPAEPQPVSERAN